MHLVGRIILSLSSILLLKGSYCIFHIWFIAHWDIHWLSQIASMSWQKSRQYMDSLNLGTGRCCPHESWNCGSAPFFSFISQGKVEWAILSSPYVHPHPLDTGMCHLSWLERSLESMKDVNNGFVHFPFFISMPCLFKKKQVLAALYFSKYYGW